VPVARSFGAVVATQVNAMRYCSLAPARLAYEEAAVILDCAVGTIKSRVSRGRAALAEVIAGSVIPAGTPCAGDVSATDRIMAEVRALETAHAGRAGVTPQGSPAATGPSASWAEPVRRLLR
jgi:hypothetical protein